MGCTVSKSKALSSKLLVNGSLPQMRNGVVSKPTVSPVNYFIRFLAFMLNKCFSLTHEKFIFVKNALLLKLNLCLLKLNIFICKIAFAGDKCFCHTVMLLRVFLLMTSPVGRT